jgi:hypothetical protein
MVRPVTTSGCAKNITFSENGDKLVTEIVPPREDVPLRKSYSILKTDESERN